MKSKTCEEDAKGIIQLFKDHNNDKKSTVKHFVHEGISKQQVYSVIRRFVNTGQVEYSRNSDPKASVLTKLNLRKIEKKFIKCSNISERKICSKIGISKGSVYRAKQKLNVTTRKKESSIQIRQEPKRES